MKKLLLLCAFLALTSVAKADEVVTSSGSYTAVLVKAAVTGRAISIRGCVLSAGAESQAVAPLATTYTLKSGSTVKFNISALANTTVEVNFERLLGPQGLQVAAGSAFNVTSTTATAAVQLVCRINAEL